MRWWSPSTRKARSRPLDRTQPGLPPKRGKCATLTHDYKGHGTTTLFDALSVLDGKVIGRCVARHRHQEFIRFIATVERSVPTGKVPWLNAVEGFFSRLTRQSLKRGVFRSVDDVESAITRYIATTSGKPSPSSATRPQKSSGPSSRGTVRLNQCTRASYSLYLIHLPILFAMTY
jgi:hypothetical protein